MVPTSTNRAACSTETPSRSTVSGPSRRRRAAGRRGGRGSRLTSSTYRSPRWARASRPGSYSATPSRSARSRCSEPITRSSVAPTGSSTSRTGRVDDAASARRTGRRGRSGRGRPGRMENRSARDRPRPAGSTAARAAHHRRLGGALLAAHQHAADLGRDRRDRARARRHVVGADDGTERGTALACRAPARSAMAGPRRGMRRGSDRGRSSDFPGRWPGSPQRACAGFSPASQILPATTVVGHLEPVHHR